MTAVRYLTLLQAAREELGWEGSNRAVVKRLKHAVITKETKLGRKFMLRWGSRGKGVRYRLTRPLMHRHLAELYDDADKVLKQVGAQVAKLLAENKKLFDRQDLLVQAHGNAQNRADSHERRIEALERRLRMGQK